MPQLDVAKIALLLVATSLSAPIVTTAWAQPPSAVPQVLAMSALGDLTPYRAIAADTLKIVDTGDLPAARTRIRDLETLWDKAEASLKPNHKGIWTVLDKAIDDALTALRTPDPKATDCATALKALIAKLDAAANA